MKPYIKIMSIVAVLFFSLSMGAVAADKGKFSTNPVLNKGKKWRIGYFEGGEYIDYKKTLIGTVYGLMELGWVEKVELPQTKGEEVKTLWNWLAANAKSKYIQFPKNAFYSANWVDKQAKKLTGQLLYRLNKTKDIDLVIASGTLAGKMLANDKHTTPTLVVSSSDPLSSGIVKAVDDSGYDHVHARVDPGRHERQVRLFHEIIGFKKLGMAFEDSDTGRSYAAIDKVVDVSKEVGFEVLKCHTTDESPDRRKDEASVRKCFQQLSKNKVDAIYVTEQNGVNVNFMPELVKITNSERIPTFAQAGSELVSYGFLVSISQAGFRPVGLFHAETIAKIFNGAKPRQLDQFFEEPPIIAINLKTAEIIGYNPPVDVLGVADEIFHEIAIPK